MLSFLIKNVPNFCGVFFDMIFLTFPIVIASRVQGVKYRELNKILLGSLFCITKKILVVNVINCKQKYIKGGLRNFAK